MDDAGAGRPEIHAVLAGGGLEKVKDLLVGLDAGGEVVAGAALADDEVVAVDAGGDGRAREVARHELQQGHLRRGVLHVDAVRVETQVGGAADAAAIVRVGEQRVLDVVEVRVEDLLGEGEALAAEDAADLGVLGEEALVSRRQGRRRGEGAGGEAVVDRAVAGGGGGSEEGGSAAGARCGGADECLAGGKHQYGGGWEEVS